MKPRPVVYFVYGTHGEDPKGIFDFIELLGELCESSEIELRFSFYPVPGQKNILMEYFNESWVNIFKQMKSTDPNTKYACIATEFITGNTFNYFPLSNQKEKLSGVSKIYSLVRRLAPVKLIKLMGQIPGVKFILTKIFGVKGSGWKSSYFTDRYNAFLKVASLCEQIWILLEDQEVPYVEKLGRNKIKILPVTPYVSKVHLIKNQPKDIDFLFSGTMTAYRTSTLRQLEELGYSVKTGFWHYPLRDHFTHRAKVCLHMRQYPAWKFTSNIRFHYYLSHGANVVAESTESKCFQENYADVVSPEDFIKRCIEAVENPKTLEERQMIYQKYFDDSKNLRMKGQELVKSFLNS